MQQETTIAIIGNGKVSIALQKGFVRNEQRRLESLEIVNRNYFEDTPSCALKKYDVIILAIRPDNAIEALKTTKNIVHKNTWIISFVSGLTIDIIARTMKIPDNKIIKATLNTNVSLGCGVIAYQGVHTNATMNPVFTMQQLFSQMTLANGLLCVDKNKVLQAVVYIGAMNAFDAKFIKLLFFEKYSNQSFFCFIQTLAPDNIWVKKYLKAKKQALENLFSFGYSVNKQSGGYPTSVHVTTFESTLQALKMMEACIEDVDTHINTVVTPNGCTEKGITEFTQLAMAFDEKKLAVMFSKVYKKTKSFEKNIYRDYKKSINTDTDTSSFSQEEVFW